MSRVLARCPILRLHLRRREPRDLPRRLRLRAPGGGPGTETSTGPKGRAVAGARPGRFELCSAFCASAVSIYIYIYIQTINRLFVRGVVFGLHPSCHYSDGPFRFRAIGVFACLNGVQSLFPLNRLVEQGP